MVDINPCNTLAEICQRIVFDIVTHILSNIVLVALKGTSALATALAIF